MDGTRTFGEICEAIRKDMNDPKVSNEEIMDDFKAMFETFIKLDWMMLRHKSVQPILGLSDLQKRMIELTQKAV